MAPGVGVELEMANMLRDYVEPFGKIVFFQLPVVAYYSGDE